jgi:protein TonB
MQGKSEPEYATTETALSRCLVDGDPVTKLRDRHRRREALGISFVIESVVLALLIVAPLMTSVAQPHFTTTSSMPLAFGGSHTAAEARHPTSTIHRSEKFRAHPFTFTMNPTARRPAPRVEEDVAPPISGAGPFAGSSPPGGNMITDFRPTDVPVQPPTEIKKSDEKRAVKISESVQQAQLVSRIEPRYPPLALQTRKEGTVLLHAIISREGRITAIEVASGSPWFVQAALDAVREWRYRPTYLNGEPVEVETSITVIFRLSQ